ncbi:MAG: DUF3472 domain-containing protein [Kiritimatiellae bacterium]|nr:DUF3472 domain-containing protein [Kiritimatiellia bacterium]
MKRLACTLFVGLFSTFLFAQSGEQQAARQARSVHLQYRGWKGPAKVFYLETTPEQSAPGTYFSMIGFDVGYCGFQELPGGEHIAIFSVWEPSNPHDYSANPNAVKEAIRTKALYHGKNVHVQRFGGEGTGGKSMMPYQWELNETVHMAISVEPHGPNRTAYTCWVWDDVQRGWFRMATFSTLCANGNPVLTSPYSFVEDFRRNVKSKELVRKARFSRLWAFDGTNWTNSSEAAFTADNNTLTTIDAGATEDGFWLATGGDTTNVTTKLWGTIKLANAPIESAERKTRLTTLIEAIRATQTVAEQPKAEPTPEAPKADAAPEAPKAEPTPEAPKAEPAPEAPKAEPAPEAPKAEATP